MIGIFRSMLLPAYLAPVLAGGRGRHHSPQIAVRLLRSVETPLSARVVDSAAGVGSWYFLALASV
jgi:hypothetical protein